MARIVPECCPKVFSRDSEATSREKIPSVRPQPVVEKPEKAKIEKPKAEN